MKRLLTAVWAAACLLTFGIERGSTRSEVLAELGEPKGSMQQGSLEILLYPTGTVTLEDGVLIEARLSQKYADESAERTARGEEIRAEKRRKLELQKRLFPEDHVTTVDCVYNQTENWSYLPENIRPAPQTFQYDVYVPGDYYRSGKKLYSCLILESPALWNSVKERVRSEKWIVVILHDAEEPHVGRTMNGNFVAAYDDVLDRFRVSAKRMFILGRVPAAVFASMRPVAGVILHNPDFSGLQNLAAPIDFLQKNNALRTYILLSNESRENVKNQARFITACIPMYHIQIYDGQTPIPPPELADAALNWMKEEYNLR